MSSFPSYKDLLLSQEWKLRRLEILKRDNHECQNCHNNRIVSRSNEGKIKGLKKVKFWLKGYNEAPIGKQYEINVEDNSSTLHTINFFTYAALSHDLLKHYTIYYEFGREDARPFVVNLITEMLKGEKLNLYVRGLHIHHKYYQYSLLPWEYPDSALVTLCWMCHKALHANKKVGCLDQNGNEMGSLTGCKRCGGSGHLPEFNHVELGICFRCWGAKYEELIERPN